jgi:hypothetical protein
MLAAGAAATIPPSPPPPHPAVARIKVLEKRLEIKCSLVIALSLVSRAQTPFSHSSRVGQRRKRR